MERNEIQDRLPLWVADRIVDPEEARAVRAALDEDPELAAEAELLRALLATAPAVPGGLEEAIRARVRSERSRRSGLEVSDPGFPTGGRSGPPMPDSTTRDRRGPWLWASWGLSAAAVALLALGTALTWDRITGPGEGGDPSASEIAMDEPLGQIWMSADGTVASEPILEGLSDEALLALIQELEG